MYWDVVKADECVGLEAYVSSLTETAYHALRTKGRESSQYALRGRRSAVLGGLWAKRSFSHSDAAARLVGELQAAINCCHPAAHPAELAVLGDVCRLSRHAGRPGDKGEGLDCEARPVAC